MGEFFLVFIAPIILLMICVAGGIVVLMLINILEGNVPWDKKYREDAPKEKRNYNRVWHENGYEYIVEEN